MTRKQKKTLIRIIVSVVLTGVAWTVDEIFGFEGLKELLLYIAPYLVIGYDNRFGHNRSEGFDDYVAFGKQIGIEVIRAKALVLNEVNVSSSVIRTFLSGGEVDLAAKTVSLTVLDN